MAASPRQDTKLNYWEDPHAQTTHNERRNPTTAIRETRSERRVVIEQAGLDPSDKRVRVLAELVDGLHQLPRHRSIHVGGFVLTEEPLSTIVPIEPASMKDRTVIQWEKDDLDPVRLVKIDLLGLGMLTLLQKCLKYIRQTRGDHDRSRDARHERPGGVRRPVPRRTRSASSRSRAARR